MKEKNNIVKQIEKLIVDGQKEVINEIRGLRADFGRRLDALEDGQKELKEGSSRLEAKMDNIHVSLKKEITATAYAIKDDIKGKIDEHARLMHA